MGYDLRFAILGPIRVCIGQREVPVTPVRERTLLAVLVLNLNQVVPMAQLVDAIWGDRPPRDARNQVQGCVSRLRQRLGRAGAEAPVVVTGPEGYAVQAPPDGVDLFEFRRLVGQARASAADGDAALARRRYREALALWRGPALAGVDSAVVRRAATGLDEERVQAWEECVEVELAAGTEGQLVAELTDLVRQYPYRERLHGALMQALCRAGRPGDALAAYQELRQSLRDELGAEPGTELQRLHRAILNREPALEASREARPSRGTPVPRQLPAEAGCFVGREAELDQVCAVLSSAQAAERRRPAVMVIYGPGGAGKSALAVRAGHQVVEGFPDGQLYVDLFGSTPGMRRLSAAEVLGRFLRSLGTPPAEIPSEEVEAAALFRTLTADRRLLLVLDNAAGREQVAAVIPSAPGCAVLITSRQPLSTLDTDGRVRLDRLPEVEAVALLTGLTAGRAVPPDVAQRIVAYSGGLPLAVRIAAGRLASRPDLPADEYAVRLADRSRRLDELQLDDLAVRDSIRTGYDALLSHTGAVERLAARAFRALGLLHVPDVAPWVVAAMLDEPAVDAVRTALDRLVDAQLLEPVQGGRYRLHDLVRLVAAERAAEEDSPADREQKFYRALEFYTSAVGRIEPLLYPGRIPPFDRPPVLKAGFLPSFDTVAQVRVWIDDELSSIVSVVEQAAATPGTSESLFWLGDAVWLHLETRCDWRTAYWVAQLILRCAEERGDRAAMALGWQLYGRSETCMGRFDAGADALERSLAMLGELNNPMGAALALNGLGIIHAKRGLHPAALECYQQALDIVRDRSPRLAATVLSNMCVTYAIHGQLEKAADAAAHSIDLAPGPRGYEPALINLATVRSMRGDHAEAMRLINQGLGRYQEAGDGMRTCEALLTRSEVNRRDGDLDRAAADAERALSEAKAWGYRFVEAAAQRQRARILSALGQEVEAMRAWALVDEAYARLSEAPRDLLAEYFLADDDRSLRAQQRAA